MAGVLTLAEITAHDTEIGAHLGRNTQRVTDFCLARLSSDEIQNIYAALVNDEIRNELILRDIVRSVESGRSPLLLTERTEHLQRFAFELRRRFNNVFELRGGLGKKQRET